MAHQYEESAIAVVVFAYTKGWRADEPTWTAALDAVDVGVFVPRQDFPVNVDKRALETLRRTLCQVVFDPHRLHLFCQQLDLPMRKRLQIDMANDVAHFHFFFRTSTVTTEKKKPPYHDGCAVKFSFFLRACM